MNLKKSRIEIISYNRPWSLSQLNTIKPNETITTFNVSCNTPPASHCMDMGKINL